MLTDEQMMTIAANHGADRYWRREGRFEFHTEDYLATARAIEREVLAEPLRLMREWVEASAKYVGTLASAMRSDDLLNAEQAIRAFVESQK